MEKDGARVAQVLKGEKQQTDVRYCRNLSASSRKSEKHLRRAGEVLPSAPRAIPEIPVGRRLSWSRGRLFVGMANGKPD